VFLKKHLNVNLKSVYVSMCVFLWKYQSYELTETLGLMPNI